MKQNIHGSKKKKCDLFVNFLWFSNGPIENRRTFSLIKIKSSEKQKRVYKLFLSESKIL